MKKSSFNITTSCHFSREVMYYLCICPSYSSINILLLNLGDCAGCFPNVSPDPACSLLYPGLGIRSQACMYCISRFSSLRFLHGFHHHEVLVGDQRLGRAEAGEALHNSSQAAFSLWLSVGLGNCSFHPYIQAEVWKRLPNGISSRVMHLPYPFIFIISPPLKKLSIFSRTLTNRNLSIILKLKKLNESNVQQRIHT